MFLLFQRLHRLIGIFQTQPKENEYLFLRQIIFIITGGHMIITSIAYLLLEANSIFEYGFDFFIITGTKEKQIPKINKCNNQLCVLKKIVLLWKCNIIIVVRAKKHRECRIFPHQNVALCSWLFTLMHTILFKLFISSAIKINSLVLINRYNEWDCCLFDINLIFIEFGV